MKSWSLVILFVGANATCRAGEANCFAPFLTDEPPKIVETILNDQIHRVLVVENRRGKDALVGLISLLDLVAAFASDECDG